MKNVGFGRSLLKVITIFCTIGCILLLVTAILALTNKFPDLNKAVMDGVTDTELRAQLPENFPGLALITAFAFSLIEVYLMWRAVKDPKKSTFLIIINLAALIGNGVYAVYKGVGGTTTSSIVWATVTLIALLCARSEVATTVEPKAKKATTKAKEAKKEEIKEGNK